MDKNGVTSEWSPAVDFCNARDAVTCDVTGDLSFCRSLNTKDCGYDPLNESERSSGSYRPIYEVLLSSKAFRSFIAQLQDLLDNYN